MEPCAAYIHVPFCAHRCGYCDFALVANRDDLFDAYFEALKCELRTLGSPRRVQTLYFGGGTPTHLPPSWLARLLKLVLNWFSVDDEFSVEANPDGLTSEKVNVLADAGVNRISLGVQSFDPATLKTLERSHTCADGVAAVDAVARRVDNISIDLIFAVPGQSCSLWESTLDRAVELRPQHISTYGLTFEKGTTFWSRRRRNAFRLVDEQSERLMYTAAMDQLDAAGYSQYETSSFASDGFRCRHNETYWAGLPYFGFGPGAARYINGRRQTSHRSVTTWIKRTLSQQSTVAESERLSDEDRAREAIALGLRRNDGVLRDTFRSYFGIKLDDLASEAIRLNRQSGLLVDDGDRITLTREGRFLADTVVSTFL